MTRRDTIIELARNQGVTNKFWCSVDTRGPNDCWEWAGPRKPLRQLAIGGYGGHYGVFNISYHKVTAHRLAYVLEYGPIPEGLEVCHTCDNPPCVNPAHLYAGTRKRNMADCKERGRKASVVREKNPNRKLSPNQVHVLRVRARRGESGNSLAKIFAISATHANRIIRGECWE